MSHDSYVSGYIVLNDLVEKARNSIDKLPSSSNEDSWPFLTSSMFSISSDPRYREDVIHFAASYKDILDSWDSWEEKFESLISEFEYYHIRVLINDCYRGDFLVAWDFKHENGIRKPIKMKRYLDYQDDKEVEFS